jgi:hypothetical protein
MPKYTDEDGYDTFIEEIDLDGGDAFMTFSSDGTGNTLSLDINPISIAFTGEY